MHVIENQAPQAPYVSVLVPVCNTAKFLPECLTSLLKQSLKNIEIICLNDGSTDNSLEILKSFQRSDGRIRIVDKENEGYGATMNLGVQLAKGEYIGIVESDDFAHKHMFKKLYTFAQKHDCDIVKCNYYEHSESGNVLQKPFEAFPKKRVFDPREHVAITGILPVIWAALYRRSMLIDNAVRFNETPGASFQDTSFVFQCWACARRVALLPKGLIYYRVDNAASSVKSSKKVCAVCKEYESSYRFLEQDPGRMDAFKEIIHVNKIGTYKWNYDRIDAASKLEFAQAMAREYCQARDKGELQERLFDARDWSMLQLLMESPEDFVKAYPETMY